jgi:membrane associated rhomboid family serine protease
MFPLKDNIPARRFPAVNLWLIVVNVLCFVYELQLGGDLERFINAYGFVPARFAAQRETDLMLAGLLPVLTSMFLHGGFLHLFSNMWMLWIFGDNVEDSMGHLRYLFFYLLCGVISVFAQASAVPDSVLPLVGASGAISGVLGAYFVLYPRARILTLLPIVIFFYLVEVPAYFFLGLWFLLQVLQGYSQILVDSGGGRGGVAWWAHVGGFFSGILLIWLFAENRFLRRRRR